MFKLWAAKILIVLCGFAALVSPLPNRRLHDFASMLSATASASLEAELIKVERETSVQVAVVTVVSLDGLSVDDYARKLFGAWGIGKKDLNNGVLFLIAPNERRARIEVGYGLEPLISDSLAGEILDTDVIPQFKQNNYESGIVRGTETIIEILRKYPEAARGVAGSKPNFVFTKLKLATLTSYGAMGLAFVVAVIAFISSKRRRFSTVVFFLALAGLIALLAYLYFTVARLPQESIPLGSTGGAIGISLMSLLYTIRRYRRYRPHHCRACKTELRLLSETEDDAKLSAGQKIEESLNSVDYDVWVCPACLKDHTEEYRAFVSSFSICPKCACRTFNETSETLVYATTLSTGLKEISGECKSCWHKTKRQEIIPIVPVTQRSSSSSSWSSGSSGGGFGGGSSGGGGSSRGW
jgi:uncharacterized protein